MRSFGEIHVYYIYKVRDAGMRFTFDKEAEETDRYGPQEVTRSVERAADRACSYWPWTSLHPIRAVARFECHRVPSGDASEYRRSEASGGPARSQESDRSRGCRGRQTRLRRVTYDRACIRDRMVGFHFLFPKEFIKKLNTGSYLIIFGLARGLSLFCYNFFQEEINYDDFLDS